MSAKAPTMRVLGRLPEGVTYSDSSRWQGVASVTSPTMGSIGDGGRSRRTEAHPPFEGGEAMRQGR